MRTSTKTNIGESKDSDKRQLRTIKTFCKSQKFNLVETFYDKNISGTKQLKERPELLKAVEYCVENNIGIIVVEHSDRFARDLVVQETIDNYKIRNRTLQNTGKCEGTKQHYRVEESDMIKIIKKLRNQDKWSFRRISKYMNIEYGMVNQNDNALHASQVKRIVEYKSIWR